jgi:voltage-gated potassium channel
MPSLRRLVWSSDTPAGRAFDLVVQSLIVVSIVGFSVETVPGLPAGLRSALRAIEIICVVAFTAEYALRLATAERPQRYVFSFFGLIDLLAILPFYLATSHDLRSVRALRLLRLFRTLKFVRYTAALDRFRAAFRSIKRELVIFGLACALALYVASVGIYYCEHDAQPEAFASVFHAMWWAVCTLTTVGYGDVYPVTWAGRLFTTVILFIGLGTVAVPSGLMATALSELSKQPPLGADEDRTSNASGP